MSVSPNELDAFYQFASQRLGNGESLPKLEDVLSEFRSQCTSNGPILDATPQIDEMLEPASDAVWSERLHQWADGFPALASVVDDSREGIYQGDR